MSRFRFIVFSFALVITLSACGGAGESENSRDLLEPSSNTEIVASPTPNPSPAVSPLPTPDITPTAAPAPSSAPTAAPSLSPEPTLEPSTTPTSEPTIEVTPDPTLEPSTNPTPEPTIEVTAEPTLEPTDTSTGPLDRSNWAITASDNNGDASLAIDGDTSTRWSTGVAQTPGQTIIINLRSAQTFNHIELDTSGSSSDYPRGYEISISNDGSQWGSIIASGDSLLSTTDISFTAVTAQYVKIEQTGSSDKNWWSIYELNIINDLQKPTCSSYTEISSITELAEYTDVSDTCIKMLPGTYYFDRSNVGEGLLFPNTTVLLFTGSNNQFVFDDVKFEFDTNIFQAFGADAINEFQVVGSNNIFKNLTMEDIGNVTPYKTALAVSIDGSDNLVDGFTITTRGSYPYGYGDIFGKGSTRVLNHKKHSGVLIRGDRNHLKGLTLYMRTYGHGVFVQGGDEVVIENVYVEGELSSVDAVLAEAGTGSDADNVDFLTVWGFYLNQLTENYRFSLQEDGIRAYSTGNIYGTSESRDTGSVTVLNSTVKFMRSGVTIGWAKGDKYVENCTTLGVESGYWVGSNATVVNSRGDASVGPLFSDDVYRSGSTVELTLLDNAVEKIGNTPSVYLVGKNHNLTLIDGTTSLIPEIEIQVGGTRYGHRWLAGSEVEPPYINADNVTLTNQTPYPVVIGENSTGATVISCGSVTDNGSNSTITNGDSCN